MLRRTMSGCFGMLMGLLFLLSTFSLTAQEAAKPMEKQEAEQAVERFYQAFYRQKWAVAAEEMHPEARATLQRLLLHIAQTTDDPKERRETLQLFAGVDTVEAFQKLDTKQIFVRLYEAVWRNLTKEARLGWQRSQVQVIGAVPEKELNHVVFRTASSTDEIALSVVSVATVKRDGTHWKLLTSTEFEQMKQKLAH
jgi:hypothetical protein